MYKQNKQLCTHVLSYIESTNQTFISKEFNHNFAHSRPTETNLNRRRENERATHQSLHSVHDDVLGQSDALCFTRQPQPVSSRLLQAQAEVLNKHTKQQPVQFHLIQRKGKELTWVRFCIFLICFLCARIFVLFVYFFF